MRGLVKRYGTTDAVVGLDLQAAHGQVTAVLGPNGAGKTTTVECAEGLRRPDAGSVRVLGLDPRADAAVLRPRVGVMLQDGGLPTGARAGQFLRHAASLYAAPASVEELSERLGLGTFWRTTVRHLSGGQYQRLALAVALVGRPEVVFLDEPSAGLDPQSRRVVWELVGELREAGVCVVLTTHLMDEAEALADTVVVVDTGAVIAEGTVAELTRSDGLVRFSVNGRRADGLATADGVDPSGGLDTSDLSAALGGATVRRATGAGAAARPVPGGGLSGHYVIDAEGSPATLATLTAWCAEHDVQLTSLQVGQRTLEDVFLDLTGRTLR